MQGNGSDLRSRQEILEQRLATLSKSVEELVGIVSGVTDELVWVLGTVNAELWRDRQDSGRPTKTLLEMDKRLVKLQDAIRKMRET